MWLLGFELRTLERASRPKVSLKKGCEMDFLPPFMSRYEGIVYPAYLIIIERKPQNQDT